MCVTDNGKWTIPSEQIRAGHEVDREAVFSMDMGVILIPIELDDRWSRARKRGRIALYAQSGSLCRDPGQSEWPCVNTEPSIAFDLGDLGDLPREWS